MTALVLSLVLAVAVAVVVVRVRAEAPQREVAALHHIYTSTRGEQWQWQWPTRNLTHSLNHSTWNFTQDSNGNYLDDPCSSQWLGVSCSSDALTCSQQEQEQEQDVECFVTALTLSEFALCGSLPSAVASLHSLRVLDMSRNSITGTIPSEVGQLSRLERFMLQFNSLSGTIPSEMGDLSSLKNLFIFVNSLTGTIPSEIGNLLELEKVAIYLNYLTGSLPREIGNLVKLDRIDLYNNLLSGSIPTELDQLVLLEWVDLEGNALTGSIPPGIGNLVKLRWLYLFDNDMTGLIPSTVGNLVELEWLTLYSNCFTGTIPTEIGNLVVLERLFLTENVFTGTLPPQFGSLEMISWLEIGRNALSGTIPLELWNLSRIEGLDLSHNFLTGTIPSEIGHLVAALLINLEDNSISGTLPNVLGFLPDLEELQLSHNILTGSVPPTLGNLSALLRLSLSHNSLTGTFPKELEGLSNLRSLLLQSNMLKGNIDGAFNAVTQTSLEVIDISDNTLTGQFSTELFFLPRLRVLALSVNCFDEVLPQRICAASHLEVLSLNGLKSAERCPNRFVLPLFDVTLFNKVGGTLPRCLWFMRNLTVLHATGNGLIGECIAQLPSYTLLRDLSLSHNRFRGNIPTGIEQISKVDLSHNQFSGNYADDTSSLWKNRELVLEFNRLSGKLEETRLENISQLQLLRGNMFTCGSIPDNDEYVDDYICGSTDFNDSLYVMGVSVLVIGCGVIVASICVKSMANVSPSNGNISLVRLFRVFHLEQTAHHLKDYLSGINMVRTDSRLAAIAGMIKKCDTMAHYISLLFAVILVMAIPIYIARGLDHNNSISTHSNTYGWFLTLAYLRGVAASLLIMLSWIISISMSFYLFVVRPIVSNRPDCRTGEDDDIIGQKEVPPAKKVSQLRQFAQQWEIVIVQVFNLVVVVVVNVLFIYSTQQPFRDWIRFGIQLSIAVFRLMYAYCVLPLLTRSQTDPITNIGYRFRMVVVIDLIVPCVATAFASPACFQGLIFTADAVSTPYTYNVCTLFRIVGQHHFCTDWDLVDVQSAPVVPPFTYNNQCSSVLLTSYIPVLIIGASIQLVMAFALPFIHYHVGKRLGLADIIGLKITKGIIWPEFWNNCGQSDSNMSSKFLDKFEKDPLMLLNFKSVLCFDILNNTMILLTFGLCSPVLAAAVTCVAVSKMKILTLLIGRFVASIHTDTDDSGLHFALAGLCKVIFPVNAVWKNAFWIIIWTSAIFFAILCWDIACDDVGWEASTWVPLTVLSYPIMIWLGLRILLAFTQRRQATKSVVVRASVLELGQSWSSSKCPPPSDLFPVEQQLNALNPLHS